MDLGTQLQASKYEMAGIKQLSLRSNSEVMANTGIETQIPASPFLAPIIKLSVLLSLKVGSQRRMEN